MAVLLPALRRASLIAALLGGAATSIADAAPPPGGGGGGGARRNKRAGADFLRSMQEATRSMRREGRGSSAQRRMDERVLSKAIPVPPKDDTPDFMRADGGGAARARGANAKGRTKKRRKLDDGGGDDEMDWMETFGFDPSEYSIKYVGCSAYAMYSDEYAEDEDATSVLENRKFVVFRLCPTSTCSDSSSEGCYQNYGEYLVPLEDYLESYAEFLEDQSELYCDYCEQCEYYDTYFYNHDDDDAAEGDNADGGDNGGGNGDQDYACKYYNECENYLYTCDYDQWAENNGYNDNNGNNNNNNNGNNNDDEELDISQFFECTEYEYGNYVYYVGPMCGEDNAITLGIFSDAYCANYVGESAVSLSELTGLDFDSSSSSSGPPAKLAQFSSGECISCLEHEVKFMVVKYEQGQEDDADDVITALCEELYYNSAKCNKRLWSDGDDGDESYQSYQSYNQMANEEQTCTFIDNVINGAYDEDGYIVVESNQNDNNNNNRVDSSSSPRIFTAGEMARATTGQILGVFFVGAGCIALLVWSVFLQRAINQQAKVNNFRNPILPPYMQDLPPNSPRWRRRAGSGVMVGRSVSEDDSRDDRRFS